MWRTRLENSLETSGIFASQANWPYDLNIVRKSSVPTISTSNTIREISINIGVISLGLSRCLPRNRRYWCKLEVDIRPARWPGGIPGPVKGWLDL